MVDNLTSLNGSFVHTIYKTNSYMVSKFESDEGTITVTGPSFEYIKGERYTICGSYIDHPKYGFQFSLVSVNKYIPSKKEEIIKFLSGASFKGVGKKAATKIYETFGDECLRIIKDDIEVLNELKLTEKQFAGIKNGIESLNQDSNEQIFLLITAGFTNNEASKIYYHYKENTAFILKDNPYKIYLDLYGIPFNKVIECAKGIDCENKESKFKIAYLVYIFKEISFKTGNIYLDESDFRFEYEKYFHDFDEILNNVLEDEYLSKEDDRYYLTSDLLDEKYIADYFRNEKESLSYDEENIKDLISQKENEFSISYDKAQIEAISSFFNEDFSMIIGGPGTGKTTLIKTLVSMFKEFFPYNNIIVVAPTGRAAKRINEICDVDSKTIHSLLKWNKETNTFIHKIDNPILYDCLIIDEFSMVDNNLFASLLKACLYVKKICIIGDDNQLPSIRQGNVLKDLIDSKRYKITYLTYNHRQKEGNEIIDLANSIVNNCVDFSIFHNDIKFYEINNFVQYDLIKLINDDLENGYDFNEIQVLSPMYKGIYGIDNLNILLQNAFNPHSINLKEKKIGKFTLRENDKILQLKNRPNDDVYNGDIGFLEEIDEQQKCIVVDYQGTKVFYEFDDLSDISLAYALSVHKAQGSEYKVVYFICDRAHINMLYKKLIYTAISRAKTKLVIIGDINVLLNGLRKELVNRKTTLKERLENRK